MENPYQILHNELKEVKALVISIKSSLNKESDTYLEYLTAMVGIDFMQKSLHTPVKN